MSGIIPDNRRRLLRFLWHIDKGYTPTAEEERELLSISELDFSRLELDKLPKCIGALASLQSLNVEGNQLAELPDCLGELSALQSLNASNNQLEKLPDVLGKLPALQSLNVENNQLAELPDSLGELFALQFLNVRNNLLEKLPDSLEELSALQSLDVSDNRLSELPDWLGKLSSLQSLNVEGNRLEELPDSLGELSALQFLDVGDNFLSELPDFLGELSSLQSLNVRKNFLEELPDGLEKLSALQILRASQNRLTALPSWIGELSSLQKLYLTGNRLTELPVEIGRLVRLEELSVKDNLLTTVPECIGELVNLQKLGLGGNKIEKFPDSIGDIRNLQELYIWENKIPVFPEQIFKLKSLQILDLSATDIQVIPPQISELTQLRKLWLSDLKLQQLPPEIMTLGLPFIVNEREENDPHDSENHDGISIIETSLATQPLSLFMQPRELIQAYFDMEQIPINEGKVIFLGHGDVGKSYSIQRILNHDEQGDFKTSMTPGISISYFPVEEDGRHFNICFWDFGGQEIMHAMHRCFLTHRTCYVVMVSNRLPDLDSQARYWLRNVESFASGSDVLLVINCWEDYPSNRDLNYSQLRTDFKNLVGYVSVSAKCDDKQTFHSLTERIIQMAAKLDSTGMNFPIQWYNIRQSLTKVAENGTYYINQDEYYQICAENGLNDPNIRIWLLEWFNDLGTCFSYHQGTDKKELRTYKVLNPEWLTNAIYIVILNGKNFTENGVISRSGIEYLLSNPTGGTLSGVTYTSEECGYILEVMRKFTLSYSVSKTEEFIPALCPNETPENLYPTEYGDHLTYELEYSYLPDTVVHQLMIYCYQYLKLDRCWRRGMSIETGIGLSAVVSMGGSDQLLKIDVYSDGNAPLWLLLQPLLEAIRKINTRLNLNAVDYVFAETVVDEEVFQDRYKLDYVLSVKKGSSKRKPSDCLQGEVVDHSIPDLLEKLYGADTLRTAEHKAYETQNRNEAALTKEVLANITLNGCTIVFDSHNEVDIEWNQDVFEEFLTEILNHQDQVTQEFLCELAQIFEEQGNAEIRELGQGMQSAQQNQLSAFEVLRERLDDADKLTSIAANLYGLWPAIRATVQKIPALADSLGDLLNQIPLLSGRG